MTALPTGVTLMVTVTARCAVCQGEGRIERWGTLADGIHTLGFHRRLLCLACNGAGVTRWSVTT